MPMNADDIVTLIKTGLPDATVQLIDLAGDGDHYRAVVTSPIFIGKSRIQQHQMVYATLGDKMGSTLHALALETKTPT